MGPIVSAIASALSGVAASIGGLIITYLGIITGAFLWLCVNILNWVLSPNFISLSYTDPARNEFLKIGWALTRDFGNIIIVLALVVIGLGTALRLAGYQAQKALPTLILIALLINFTPVICGLVVDAANILITFFTGEGIAGGNSFINLINNQSANIQKMAGGGKLWDPTASGEAIAAAAGGIALIIFNVYAGVVYLLFALIFMVRYVAIWVLVILSPIAFACYILPDTRKVFTQWWTQFFQWSFIGVIGSFFLYLTDHFLKATQSADFHSATSTLMEVGSAPGLSGIINNIMPFVVVIVFLTMGLMLTLSSSAAGASGVMNFAQKQGKKFREWAGKRSLSFARDKTPEGVRRWAERQATAKKWGEGEKGFTGLMKRTLDTPRAFTRHAVGGIMAGTLSERKSMAEAHKKAKERDMRTNQMEFAKATDAERVEIMRAEREKGRLPKFVEGLQQKHVFGAFEKAMKLDDKDMGNAIARANVDNIGDFETILNKKMGYNSRGLDKEDAKKYDSLVHKLMEETVTEDQTKEWANKWYDKADSDGTKLIQYGYNSSSLKEKQYTWHYQRHGQEFENAYVKQYEDIKQSQGENTIDYHFQPNKNGRPNAPNALFNLNNAKMRLQGRGLGSVNPTYVKQKAEVANIYREAPGLRTIGPKKIPIDEIYRQVINLRRESKGLSGPRLGQIRRDIQDYELMIDAAKLGLKQKPDELQKVEEIERIIKYKKK